MTRKSNNDFQFYEGKYWSLAIHESYLILVLVTVIFIFFPAIPFCQDILFLRSGEEQKVKVKRVGIEKVEYIRFDNQSGPIYDLNRSDLLKIVYENGTKE